MKADGVEYDARMDALEQVEHPKPGKEFIYQTYNDFVITNPWAKEASVKPKSIAREMFEDYSSFEDYIKTYGLEKSEAILLRHLSEVYKILAQTVPPSAKTEELEEAETYFGEMLRTTDSSIIDEWEKRSAGVSPTQQPEKKIQAQAPNLHPQQNRPHPSHPHRHPQLHQTPLPKQSHPGPPGNPLRRLSPPPISPRFSTPITKPTASSVSTPKPAIKSTPTSRKSPKRESGASTRPSSTRKT